MSRGKASYSLTPALAASLLLEMHEPRRHSQKQPDRLMDDLTGHEREILESLTGGLSNKEIGEGAVLLAL